MLVRGLAEQTFNRSFAYLKMNLLLSPRILMVDSSPKFSTSIQNLNIKQQLIKNIILIIALKVITGYILNNFLVITW